MQTKNFRLIALKVSALSATLLVSNLILCSSIALSVNVDDSPKYLVQYGELQKGTKIYTFRPKTELKDKADATSKTVAELSPGSVLSLLSKDEKKKSVNGFEDYWYKLKTAKGESGFVWGGDLSKGALELSPGSVLVMEIEGTAKDKMDKKANAILIKNGKVVSQASFKPIEMPEAHSFSYNVAASKFDGSSFAGKPTMARFYFNYEACDYPFGDVLVGVMNDKVKFLLEQTGSAGEAGSSTYEFVLPTEKGGAAGKLVVKRTLNDLEKKKKTHSRETFRWDADHFSKEK